MEKVKSWVSYRSEGHSSEDFVWSQAKERRHKIQFIEFLGSAVVSFAFTLSFFDYFARATAFFMCFVLFYHISGAHFNPATSFAVYIKEKMAGKYKTESD